MRAHGHSAHEILERISQRQSREPDVHGARLFGLVYPTGREDIETLIHEVNSRYLFGNALNPFRFPELAAMEADVVDSCASLLNRESSERRAGAMTSGGTESIVMAMLVHRQRARARGVHRPNIVVASSAHPAYAKAAHYLDMDLVTIPINSEFRADAQAARDMVTEQTAVVVASAFCYPYGVMDPVRELASIAAGAGAGCHVDACIGGFVLPFLERLGRDASEFDFRVPGVTSLSVDVHKYGYAPKGASVLLHRDDDWFANQFFLYDQWGSGLYGSAGVAGARPASPVACAWAVINYLGVAGYVELMQSLMTTTDHVRNAMADLDGVSVVGRPVGPVFALSSATVDLHQVADLMEQRGWFLNRNTTPRGVHLMMSPAHAKVADQLVSDFSDCFNNASGSSTTPVRYS